MHKYLKALEDISNILKLNITSDAKIEKISEAIDEVNKF